MSEQWHNIRVVQQTNGNLLVRNKMSIIPRIGESILIGAARYKITDIAHAFDAAGFSHTILYVEFCYE